MNSVGSYRAFRRASWLSATALMGLMASCATITTTDGTRIRQGLPEAKLADKIGPPDAIGQTSGGQSRYYLPGEAPEEAWTDKGLVTNYYYLDRGYKIVITEERVRETQSISRQELDAVLPMVREKRAR